MEDIKSMPYSREAEMYVIGSILIDPPLAKDIVLRLDAKDFHIETNQIIMKAIFNLVNNNVEVDIVTLVEELKRMRVYETTVKNEYLYEVMESIPTTTNVDIYIETVKEKALQRELYNTTSSISKLVLDNKLSFNKLLDQTEISLKHIIEKRRTTEFLKVDTAADQALDMINDNQNKVENDITGIDTGYKDLNKITYGFQKGELVILAARPAVGKSALALNIAINAASYKSSTVAFFSLEMSTEQLLLRMISSISGVSLMKLRGGKLEPEEMAAIKAAKNRISKLDIYMDDQYTNEVSQLADKCKKLKKEHKLDLIIVDYLQLLKSSGTGSRVEEVSRISRALKMLAREADCPVLALSQLSRDLEKREDKRPILADLRESGSIEQDADIVMFLYRESNAKIEKIENLRSAKTELIVAKNRQGQTDTIVLLFNGAQSLFSLAPKEKNK